MVRRPYGAWPSHIDNFLSAPPGIFWTLRQEDRIYLSGNVSKLSALRRPTSAEDDRACSWFCGIRPIHMRQAVDGWGARPMNAFPKGDRCYAEPGGLKAGADSRPGSAVDCFLSICGVLGDIG